MKKWARKIIQKGIPGLCLLMLLGLPVRADEMKGSITVLLKEEQGGIPGVTFELYQAGTVDSSGNPELYERYGTEVWPQTAEEAEAVMAVIESNLKEEPLQTQVTDVQGKAQFEELERGVYYVRAREDNPYGSIQPFLVQLPFYETTGGTVTGPYYDAEAEPKAEPYPEEPGNPEEPEEPGEPGDKEPEDKGPGTEPGSTGGAKTGDMVRSGWYLILMLSGLYVLAGITRKNVRRREE